MSCEDERGGVRSRDLDLSSLLERPLVQLRVGDEGFISETSSSDVRSRDLDRPLDSLLVVTDHHHHHPYELEYVEARVVKVSEVLAHAMDF